MPEEIVFASAKMAFHGDVARAATIPSVVFQTWLVTTSEFLHSAIVFAIWSTWPAQLSAYWWLCQLWCLAYRRYRCGGLGRDIMPKHDKISLMLASSNIAGFQIFLIYM